MDSRISNGAAAVAAVRQGPNEAPAANKAGSTYGEILKFSILIGGSTALNIAISIVRTKVLAILLGRAGFRLMGVYSSLAELVRSAAEMGISRSGVRQVAESVGTGEIDRIARTVLVLRRTTILMGMVGALLTVLFARPISTATFGTDAHACAVALLSVAIFLQVVAGGQGALIQGMRRISDIARISVFGFLLGTLATIPIVYYLGADGVVPALVAMAGISAAAS